jgi:hypothetical protein
MSDCIRDVQVPMVVQYHYLVSGKKGNYMSNGVRSGTGK